MEKAKRKPQAFTFNIFGAIFGLISSFFGGIWWAIKQVTLGIWWAIGTVANGVWWLVRNGASIAWWVVTRPYYVLHYLLNGPVPEFETAREKTIFWRVKRRYRRKRIFILHSLFYSIAAVMSVGYTITNGLNFLLYNMSAWEWDWYVSNVTGILVVGSVWTVILGFHRYFNSMHNEEDEAVGQALAEEYARQDDAYHYAHLEDGVAYDDADYYDAQYIETSKQKRRYAK